jgi:hypothetical protein
MNMIAVKDQKTAETQLIQLDLVRTITMGKNALQFQFGLSDSWSFSREQLGDAQFDELSATLRALAP